MDLIRQLLDLFTPRERRRLYLLLPAVVVTGLMEVAGVASIAPFLSVVTDPSSIEKSPLLAWVYGLVGEPGEQRFIFVMGLLVLAVLLLSNALGAATHYALYRFGYLSNHTISRRLLISYLEQPYSFFLRRNSAELVNTLLQEVLQVVNGIVVPALQICAKGVAALFIVVLLVAVDPMLALVVSVLLGGTYALIYLFVRRRLKRFGNQRLRSNARRMKAANEAVGGIKELKLLGREEELVEQFSWPSHRFALATAGGKIVGALPKYALEAVAFGGILIVLLFLVARGAGSSSIIPLVGLYAFAGYRLLPALQEMFSGMTRIKVSRAALEEVRSTLGRAEDDSAGPWLRRGPLEPLPIREGLELRSVSFRYEAGEAPVLEDIDLSIRPNSWVAFVGATGSGKSTLVDVILGLLRPERGSVRIDGVELGGEALARWQRGIGYVPQQIYLADDTVARNIAFGVRREEIDMGAVHRAAEVAQVREFIESLPRGFDTEVGEHGIRLSGGQRQRFGIARALYHDPDTLVLDEATSALDNVTETKVFGALTTIARAKTVIMVAHRLSTVQECDEIHLLRSGRIEARGSYRELLARSPSFREMVDQGSGATVGMAER